MKEAIVIISFSVLLFGCENNSKINEKTTDDVSKTRPGSQKDSSGVRNGKPTTVN